MAVSAQTKSGDAILIASSILIQPGADPTEILTLMEVPSGYLLTLGAVVTTAMASELARR